MPYGGIAASGLGGLLVGGARRTPEELRAHKLAMYALKPPARANLEELIAAERWASHQADAAHKWEFGDALIRDANQDYKILQRKSFPQWASNEYNYHLYERRPRAPMSVQQKHDMAVQRLARKHEREASHTPKINNPATGRLVYVDSKIGQSLGSVPASRIQRALRHHQANKLSMRRRPIDEAEEMFFQPDFEEYYSPRSTNVPRGKGRPPKSASASSSGIQWWEDLD